MRDGTKAGVHEQPQGEDVTVLSSLVALVTWLRQLVLQWYQQQRGAVLAAMTTVWMHVLVTHCSCRCVEPWARRYY